GMFKHFIVKNFRGFSSLRLKNLARINLIAGKNNTGKTALLEAIHLHCHPDDSLLPTQINELRQLDDSGKLFEDLWAWLFLDKNPALGIELTSYDEKGLSHVVTYQLLDANAARDQYPDHEVAGDSMSGINGWYPSQKRLVVRYEGPNGVLRTIGI